MIANHYPRVHPTPYAAWLRVYEPYDAFSSQDQIRFSPNSTLENSPFREQLNSIGRLINNQFDSDYSDGFYVITRGGKRFISPWSTEIRSQIAFQEFRSSLPESISAMFFSNFESIEANLDSQINDSIPHILTTTWMIPPRWFALFDENEKLTGSNHLGPFVILRTEIALAKARCKKAHAIVHKAFGSGPVESEIAQLLSWLEAFNPESILECDYGGLATYLHQALLNDGKAGIEADSSIRDVHEALEGLSAGDGARAGESYARLVTHWRRVATFEQAS